jgi:XTP/dITP diphosphohydrolase
VKLLFATRNPGKVRELQALATGLDVLSLADFSGVPEVEETEDTLQGNARLKALTVSRLSGLWALADDSGLFVDALGGAPGVHSARYAKGSDADRVAKLLHQMEGVPDGRRGAVFRCALALASPAGEVTLAEGECRGEVLRAPRGSGGFGYDPVLLLPELGRTMAELTLEEKGRFSHRARAFERMRPNLTDLARRGSGESF